ncbi:unnamed protein product [Rotaria sordida]|uniref:Aminotransferase class I/classII large domain-containing protein n=1 Tax=Rotaria sordida TaxID=392033 RepID=A0A813REM3_9BILA|nr:unnamed protein product [Rotaria sordida]CAF3590871.1 unnamed protein product [Rotaria sordida]
MASSNEESTKNKTLEQQDHLLSKRYIGLEHNVWTEFTTLAVQHNAVNLGQGFIDYEPPQYFLDIYDETVKEHNKFLHQYTRGFGHRRLVEAISNVYSLYFNRKIDPFKEILIAGGAYPSLFNAIHSIINPGDEVILIEPFFDCYEPMVRSAGGIVRCIPLRPKPESLKQDISSSSDWILDKNELELMFNSNTRLIILNTPNNPLGKVFTLEELEHIASLCQKYNVICISDEVYEWITYDNKRHIRIGTLPNMWQRTLTIGSAGKTFSATGLKLGWTIGPENLIRLNQIVHQHTVYLCPTLSQEVVARCFEYELKRLNSSECYFNSVSKEFIEKRNQFAQVLKECGMKPIVPDGSYFMLADFSSFVNDEQFQSDENDKKDFKFVRYLIKEKQLAAIPVSAFYTKNHQYLGENYIRFCFAKHPETLDKATNILRKLRAH